MTDYFISYNRADLGWAKWIDYLNDGGIPATILKIVWRAG